MTNISFVVIINLNYFCSTYLNQKIMKSTFYKRGDFMHVRIPKDGRYLRLTTGIRADRSDVKREVARHKAFFGTIGNQNIKAEYEEFLRPIQDDRPLGHSDLISICADYLNKARNGKIRKKDGSKIKASTINNYETAVKSLKKYADSNSSLDLAHFDLSTEKDIRKKRVLSNGWHNYFQEFIEFMKAEKFKVNSMSNVMVIISIIIKHYVKDNFMVTPELPTIKAHNKPIVVLPPEFIKTFLADYNSFQGEQKYVWEICATILVTTMRICDVLTLCYQDLSDKDGILNISKVNQKTGAMTEMQLPKVLSEIFKKNMAEFGGIYTPVTARKESLIYSQAPVMMSKYEELKADVSISEVNADGVYERTTKPLYEYVTPHMLRKTAITSMLVNGVSEQHVKFASGHSDNSQAFERYRGFIDRNFQNEISSYYESFT